MRALKITFIQLLFFISFVNADELKTVKLKGSISTKGQVNKEGSIWFDVHKNPSIANIFKYESFEAHLDNEGCFEIDITPPSDFFYVDISSMLPPGIKKVYYTNYNKGKFLLNQNDNLTMVIEDERISFSGRGADRLNCQQEILQMLYRFTFKMDKNKENDYYSLFKNTKVALEEIEMIKLSVLEKYNALLGQREIKLISEDIRCMKEEAMLSFMGNFISMEPESQKGGEQFYNEFYDNRIESISSLTLQTAYVTDYLFKKAKVKAILKTMTPEIDLEIFTDSLFNIIIEDYEGEVRDRLLVNFFISRQDRMSKEQAEKLYEAAFTLVKTDYCKVRLTEWGDISFNFKPMYPFELVSEKGETFAPADFNGKVVIFKFWFLGCVPCARLSTQMKPIMDQYASNTDVVFVNVNVDDYREQWIIGLQSGDYSNNDELNLYTNGIGRNHPMLKYFNFTGFPQLLMMDKSGNCLDRFIERPVDEESSNRFCDLIDNALNSR